MPDIRSMLDSQGSFPSPSAPAEFASLIKSEIERYGEVITTAGIKIQ